MGEQLTDQIALDARYALKNALFYLRSKKERERDKEICAAIYVLTPKDARGVPKRNDLTTEEKVALDACNKLKDAQFYLNSIVPKQVEAIDKIEDAIDLLTPKRF